MTIVQTVEMLLSSKLSRTVIGYNCKASIAPAEHKAPNTGWGGCCIVILLSVCDVLSIRETNALQLTILL